MSSFPWLTVIGAIPLVGALVITLIPAASSADTGARAARDLLIKRVALVVSLVTLGMTVAMAVKFSPNGPDFQFVEIHQWIPEFGVHYAVGVDGIALVLIGMTAVLMPVVILASWHDADPPSPRARPPALLAPAPPPRALLALAPPPRALLAPAPPPRALPAPAPPPRPGAA